MATKTSWRWMMAIAWIVVGTPLAWGVTQTFNKSLDLFHVAHAPTTAPATQPAK